jgi:hypothetical protein
MAGGTGYVQAAQFDFGDTLARPYRSPSCQNPVFDRLATAAADLLTAMATTTTALAAGTLGPGRMPIPVFITVVAAIRVVTAAMTTTPASGVAT